MDYDSFTLASPGVTRSPLWKFVEENPTGSQAQPQAQTTNVQAQPVTSTPLKPSGCQTLTQAIQFKLGHRLKLRHRLWLWLKLSHHS